MFARTLENSQRESLSMNDAGNSIVRIQRLEQSAARLSLAAATAFLAMLAALHVLRPDLDPSWRFISEYEQGGSDCIGPHRT
jgi:hypothetical protein